MNVPREPGVLTQRELEITENYDATALVEKLARLLVFTSREGNCALKRKGEGFDSP